MTDTDRDKYCVNRIIDFYKRQPTDLADYFLAAWRFKHRAELGKPDATLAEIAADERGQCEVPRDGLVGAERRGGQVGPMATLQTMWRELPSPCRHRPRRHTECALRRSARGDARLVEQLRRKLEPKVNGLEIPGVHEGSQSFVLWKNRQYAANRRTYSRDALKVTPTGQGGRTIPTCRSGR